MIVALAQTHILWEDKEKNLAKAASFMKNARLKGAEILFFPEMSLTGFSMNTEITAEKDLPEEIKRLCQEEKINVGIGWTKRGEQKAENHYTVINKEGDICSDYVKIHPFSYAGEANAFQGGNEILFYQLGGYSFSTFICYDLRFPELFQIASQKADVIVVPANWPAKREEHWKTLLKARAIECQSYILGINCVGTTGGIMYNGFTSAYSPEGECLTKLSGEEGIVTLELYHECLDIRNSFPVKQDRKWQFYSKKYRDVSDSLCADTEKRG